MEIPDKVLDSLLYSMARSDLESDIGIESDFKEKEKPKPKIKKEKVERKTYTLLSNPTTVLFSKDGKYRAMIRALFNADSDDYSYKVDVTGRIYDSQRMAINNARRWLKKKRFKFYKKHPEKKPRIKTVRIIPKKKSNRIKTIHKLYVMEKDTARILVRMSHKKLKIHENYSRKKFDSKKTTAISGDTKDFNVAIYNVMKDGTKKERRMVSKMLRKFTNEPHRKTNMFY